MKISETMKSITVALHTLTEGERLALDLHHALGLNAAAVAKRLAVCGAQTSLAEANSSLERALGQGLKHDLVAKAVNTIVARRSAVYFDEELRIIVAATLLKMVVAGSDEVRTNAKHLGAQFIAATEARFYKVRWGALHVLTALNGLAEAQIIHRDRTITIRDLERLQAEADRILPAPTGLIVGKCSGDADTVVILPKPVELAA